MNDVRFVKDGVARALRTLRAATSPEPRDRVVPFVGADDRVAVHGRSAGRRRREPGSFAVWLTGANPARCGTRGPTCSASGSSASPAVIPTATTPEHLADDPIHKLQLGRDPRPPFPVPALGRRARGLRAWRTALPPTRWPSPRRPRSWTRFSATKATRPWRVRRGWSRSDPATGRAARVR